MRLIARVVLALVANALGLWVADLVLDDMHIHYPGDYLIEVGIFTLVVVLVQPMIIKATLRKTAAISGSSALVATLVGLIVTVIISDTLTISGFVTWLAATVIVWLISLLGALVLPMFLFKKTMGRVRARAA